MTLDVIASFEGFRYGLMLSGSSSDIRRGEAKADPIRNEIIPIKTNFDVIFSFYHHNILAKKSLLALIIEQFRSSTRTQTCREIIWVWG